MQTEIDEKLHIHNLEMIRLQNDLGVKVIQAKRDVDLDRTEVAAWAGLVDSTARITGIRFIDVWNGIIRPLLATLAISFITAEIIRNGFILSDWDRELVGAILGIYIADRSLYRRGK